MANHDLKKPLQKHEGWPLWSAALETGPAPSAHARSIVGAGVCSFAEHYDLFIVDQWGVLHDGRMVYPGVADCLRRLLTLGKRVVILSNSGQRAKATGLRLGSIGITEDCYTLLITSGEIAREHLAARMHPFLLSIGRRRSGSDSLYRCR